MSSEVSCDFLVILVFQRPSHRRCMETGWNSHHFHLRSMRPQPQFWRRWLLRLQQLWRDGGGGGLSRAWGGCRVLQKSSGKRGTRAHRKHQQRHDICCCLMWRCLLPYAQKCWCRMDSLPQTSLLPDILLFIFSKICVIGCRTNSKRGLTLWWYMGFFSDKNTLLEFGALWWDNQNRYMPFFAPSVAALNSDDDVFISVFSSKKWL